MRQSINIARSSFRETIRQPMFGAVLSAATVLIMMGPFLAMYTFNLGDEGLSHKLVIDMGLATILMAGLLQAVLSASTVVSSEIEGKTALTVLTKPVGRTSFVVGKFFGVSVALAMGVYILSIVVMFADRFGVKDTVSTPQDWGVYFAILLATLASLGIGFVANYFFGRPFLTIAIVSVFATMSVALLAFSILDKKYGWSGFGAGLNWQVMVGGLLMLEAILILAVVAIAASTRGGVVAALSSCLVVFFLGMINEYLFGEAAANGAWYAKICSTVLPDFQVFWVTESLTLTKSIPADYIFCASIYTVFYTAAVLSLASMLFCRRELS